MTKYEKAKSLALLMLKETPNPTPEDIRTAVEQVLVWTNKGAGNDSVDPEHLIRDIETTCETWRGNATLLRGKNEHKTWLPAKKSQIKWSFWKRYERYLMEEKCYAEQSIFKLDELTDRILENLEDPRREDGWDTRGMVVGYVQSGKTSNYTGLICKAADAGYKLIIVLAGMHKSLRSQTQLRLDEGFLGYDSRMMPGKHVENRRLGVGNLRGEENIRALWITNSADDGDFKLVVARQSGIVLGGDPVLLVVKKNKSILSNLVRWAGMCGQTDPSNGDRIVIKTPLLVIDDEADNASVNTNPIPLDGDDKPEENYDVSAINGKIRELLKLFEQSAYIGYTATPFANIFIYPQGETQTHGEDLFPGDFIINLPAPPNYLGSSELFGFNSDSEEQEGLPIIRVINDYQKFIPDIHDKNHDPENLPESLKTAIYSFIITCAAREARGTKSCHNSMLVHVTRYTKVQKKIVDLIKQELAIQRRKIEYGLSDSANPVIMEMEKLWKTDFIPTTESIQSTDKDPMITDISWESVKEFLYPAVSKMQVKEINGTAKDILDYRDYPDGLNIIAVGGDKLSRGLTLEGLSVSYYLRASRMYDTLMQMGRWFGFRPGYLDLCRLYTSHELVEWYRFINLAYEELRSEFDYMASCGATPAEFGFRVRTHPEGLLITSVNKMRSGTEMNLSYSNSLIQTVFFHKDKKTLESNLKAIENLMIRLGKPHKTVDNNLVWGNIPPENILDLISEFIFHESSLTVNPKLLKEYIEKQNTQNIPELKSWTIIVISKSNAKNKITINGSEIGLTVRNPDKDKNNIYAIKKGQLISPRDEFLDLSVEEKDSALRAMRREKPDAELPSGPFIRSERKSEKGLLLIYPLDEKAAGVEIPVIGLAISFPESKTAVKLRYKVNNTYWGQEFGNQSD